MSEATRRASSRTDALDHVKPGMSVGEQEIFGPVLCIKRVKDFEEGLELMNANEFANGSGHLHAERP